MDAPYIDPYPTPSGQPLLEPGSAPDGMKQQRERALRCMQDFLRESRNSAYEWQVKSKKAWDMIHGRIDWSHKGKDQSKVHLNRVGLAQEQIKAQIRQGLVNFEDWLIVEADDGFESDLMTEAEAKRLVLRLLDRTDPRSKLTENVGIAAVENMLATKLQPIVIEKRAPGGKIVKEFHVDLIPLNIRSFYPDARYEVTAPTPLYAFHEVQLNKFQVLDLSSDTPDLKYPYRKDVAKRAQPKRRIEEQKESQDRGNDVLQDAVGRRQICVLHEFHGTLLDDDGSIMVWKREDGTEFECKNVMATMINENEILQDPVPSPFWDSAPPFVVTQLLRTNINVYGKSLLMPGVDMNRAEDELLNAGIDAGLREGYNVNVLKLHGLADRRQASGGIKYGMTLFQNNQLAPGESLMDTVTTGKVPQGLLMILDRVHSAGAENMRLNEISLTGQLQSKQTRATEIVAAGQTIQGLFEAIVGDLEDAYIEKLALKTYLMGLQYAKMLTDRDLEYIFFSSQERVAAFKTALKKPRAVYDDLACCFRFRGKGVRSLAANAHQAQAIIQLFGIVTSNPMLMDAFEREGLNVTKLLNKVMKGFHLDMQEFYDNETKDFAKLRQMIREQALAQAELQNQNPAQPGQQTGQAPQPMGIGAQGAVQGQGGQAGTTL